MTLTYREYPPSDSRVLYPVDFDLGYLRKEYVFVYSGDNPQIQLDYTWVNANEIELATPPTEPFTIRRLVESNELVNDYVAGAILSADNLDDSFMQTLMLAQEMGEKIVDTERNVIACRNAQTASQANALTSQQFATTATLEALDAGQASRSAGLSAQSAKDSTTVAKAWAQNDVGKPVETGKYSAYHWARQAQEIAQTVALGVTYRGGWDASGGKLPHEPAVGASTDMYIISKGGTLQGEAVQEGDQIVYNKDLHRWEIFQLANAVKSVNGQTGLVTITADTLGVYTEAETRNLVQPKADTTALNAAIARIAALENAPPPVSKPTKVWSGKKGGVPWGEITGGNRVGRFTVNVVHGTDAKTATILYETLNVSAYGGLYSTINQHVYVHSGGVSVSNSGFIQSIWWEAL